MILGKSINKVLDGYRDSSITSKLSKNIIDKFDHNFWEYLSDLLWESLENSLSGSFGWSLHWTIKYEATK